MPKWKNINDKSIAPPELDKPLVCIMKYRSCSLVDRFAYRLLYKSTVENEHGNCYYSASNCMPLDNTMYIVHWMYADEFAPEYADDMEDFMNKVEDNW